MDNMFHAGGPRSIHECFALPEHINGVARHHEDGVDVLHGRFERFDAVKIKSDCRDV
jgi:hypothetical protein